VSAMSRPNTVVWFEPYWSYHQEGRILRTSMSLRTSLLKRLLVVAYVTFIVVALVLLLLFPTVFSMQFVKVAIIFVLWLAAIVLWIILWKLIVPGLDWLIPRWIRVCPQTIEVIHHSSKRLRIETDAISEAFLNDESPGFRSLTVKWDDSELTVGIPARVKALHLKELIGDRFRLPCGP